MEQERGWDPQVKNFFVKILRSFSWGMIWLLAGVMLGIYYQFGDINRKPVIYPILFYAGMILSLLLLIRYLYRVWKNG